MSEPVPELTALINQLSVEFDQRTLDRHEVGQQKYGPFSFLEKDMIEEAILEALDFANYMRYAYIKLRMLQEALRSDPRLESLADEEQNVTIGTQSFRRQQ